MLAASLSFAPADAGAAEATPVGGWRTTNECFLALLLLTEDGRARAAYLSGENDDNATWRWDGMMLTVTSMRFPLDRFGGRLTGGGLAADYVWHERETDLYHRQECTFEKVEPPRGGPGNLG
jgi:hypothetical protein